MGYHSSVMFIIKGQAEAVRNLLAAHLLTGTFDAAQREALSEVRQLPQGDGTLVLKFHLKSVKWYTEFDEVKVLNSLYLYFEEAEETAEGEDPRFNGAFVRLGEDNDDNDVRHFGETGYELCWARRTIESDY